MKQLKFLSLILALMLTVGLTTSNAAPKKNQNQSKVVTVYSPHPTEAINLGVKEFQQKTGITVELVAAGTGELLKRVEAESANPMGDVFWGGGAESVQAYSKYFAKYVSKEARTIDGKYKDPKHFWTGESPLPMVIMYNKKLVAESDVPKGWGDLLKPAFKGKIAYADPAKSGSSYTILVTMITAFGKNDNKGWDFIRKFVANLDGKILSSSGGVYKGVSDGEYSVGLTLEKEAIKYVKAGANVGMIYPVEGTSAVPDAVAVIKGCKNPENARKFVDFVLGKECQSVMSTAMSRRPARSDLPAPEGLPDLSKIKMVKYDFNWAATDKDNILKKWKDIVIGK
jgi:iron(III) transport system substrate-binding protein